ncbi:hypothetical protein GDO78_003826 [Eleutherodactylus coqui]|uniref:Uncharacterized protein n=1 Tax=Eleutherodactylus coqui TaxID=57060 RepID=A0A8J6EUM2_ELECQ|nr:hypothetical protein GDO78_003826 [Eleutherodactylus coqui]
MYNKACFFSFYHKIIFNFQMPPIAISSCNMYWDYIYSPQRRPTHEFVTLYFVVEAFGLGSFSLEQQQVHKWSALALEPV